ncbi:unnamed protein product [Dibothriocephalus latus]|uniref:Uncharacterized protein n=1 Tax=Dibothriocephalus latus TaxID=60516 RepID=A0A3P7P5N7_DIBLA|nr:unnamed protein product [Dibothriocephalus latus]
MRPQPCLALVPYTPRIPLPGLATKKPAPQTEEEVDKDEEDSDKDATMDASGPPPTCPTSPLLLSWPSPSFSPPSGLEFIDERNRTKKE